MSMSRQSSARIANPGRLGSSSCLSNRARSCIGRRNRSAIRRLSADRTSTQDAGWPWSRSGRISWYRRTVKCEASSVLGSIETPLEHVATSCMKGGDYNSWTLSSNDPATRGVGGDGRVDPVSRRTGSSSTRQLSRDARCGRAGKFVVGAFAQLAVPPLALAAGSSGG